MKTSLIFLSGLALGLVLAGAYFQTVEPRPGRFEIKVTGGDVIKLDSATGRTWFSVPGYRWMEFQSK